MPRRTFTPRFRPWAPYAPKPSQAEIAERKAADAARLEATRAEVRKGRVMAGACFHEGATRCFIGTITGVARDHFTVTTRGGTKLRLSYAAAMHADAFAHDFASWDLLAEQANALLIS